MGCWNSLLCLRCCFCRDWASAYVRCTTCAETAVWMWSAGCWVLGLEWTRVLLAPQQGAEPSVHLRAPVHPCGPTCRQKHVVHTTGAPVHLKVQMLHRRHQSPPATLPPSTVTHTLSVRYRLA